MKDRGWMEKPRRQAFPVLTAPHICIPAAEAQPPERQNSLLKTGPKGSRSPRPSPSQSQTW